MQINSSISQFFNFPENILQADLKALALCEGAFAHIKEIKEFNQFKMLKTFNNCGVGTQHLVGTTGYGIGDIGREKIEQVFAQLTGSEASLFRHNFASGTHALSVALFGVLRPGDTMLSVTGRPYDTLHGVLGIGAQHKVGSLKEFGIEYKEIELINGKTPNFDEIAKQCKDAKMCYIQRSRGYSTRSALSLSDIKSISDIAKAANSDIIIMVDNCYGEFTQKQEPPQFGADLMAGSLIKNPGGGIAPTGGYIAGKAELVELCAHRLNAPGVGGEIGCTLDVLRQMFLGLYYAPLITSEALKASVYASALFEVLGYETSPTYTQPRNDIITSVHTKSEAAMCALCEGVQSKSPVDSFAAPVPDDMPGYDDKVIMAAGAFTMGSSIELSADGPIRAPYTVYLQGALNFNASRAGILQGACNMEKVNSEKGAY